MGTIGTTTTVQHSQDRSTWDEQVEKRDGHGLRLQKQQIAIQTHKIIPPLERVTRVTQPEPLTPKIKGSRPPTISNTIYSTLEANFRLTRAHEAGLRVLYRARKSSLGVDVTIALLGLVIYVLGLFVLGCGILLGRLAGSVGGNELGAIALFNISLEGLAGESV